MDYFVKENTKQVISYAPAQQTFEANIGGFIGRRNADSNNENSRSDEGYEA